MDYHSHRFEDFSLLVYKNEKLLALLPANKSSNIVYSHQGLSYGGLIYPQGLKTTDYLLCFQHILKFLENHNISSLALKELPAIYLNNHGNNPLQYICFKSKAEWYRTDMLSVIQKGEKKMSSSRKEGFKRGKKNNLRFEETQTFDTFWNEILIPNLQNKHQVKPVHSLEEITLLKNRFDKNIRQFNVYKNEKLVAGTTIFETKNVAHCQYISGNQDKNELGSLDFLFTTLIEDVFATKPFFDFGTSNINSGENVNNGLQFWKEGFGARSITQNFYKIETKNHKLLETVFV